MLPEPDTYDLNELSGRAGVTPRTVRYYVQQGLLPSPGARGPGARYDSRHLDRLSLIRRLQREHLPLAEIRRRLEALDDAAVRELAQARPEQPASSALAYVRDVLAGKHAMRQMEEAAPYGPEPVRPAERSQWERITLAPDVELHVRRPLAREQNRKVERLISSARKLFEENAP
jgi:DNA-binding transcriptional MerR regulator